jgi:hypothetical protein
VIKELIVGTWIGRTAMQARRILGILQAIHTCPENVGALLNDHCAHFLVSRICKKDTSFVGTYRVGDVGGPRS